MAAEFDFKNPDYLPIFRARVERLNWLRTNPDALPALISYYRAHIADFINDWGMIHEPRNVGTSAPASLPFVLFPRQRDWIDKVVEKWGKREPLVTEKSRDAGVSWLSIATGASICMLYQGATIGYGSKLVDLVDDLGNPKSLFWKARHFIEHVPEEFRPGWDVRKHAPHKRIIFPHSGSAMTGEGGDEIGRGGRTTLFFLDESAHIERPKKVDAALSATTMCRIDISSANGTANSFYQRRMNANIENFTFHWRQDPRKDQAWYDKQVAELDPVVVAQEIDINYAASVTGVLIPSSWVQAAVDADKMLGFTVSGKKSGALDVADEGIDLNAFCHSHGIAIENVTAWSGKGDDIFGTVQEAFRICDEYGLDGFEYDADGLGAGVRGDARVINDQRRANKVKELKISAFRGSGEVYQKEKPIPTALPGSVAKSDRKNGDFFANAKAQAWWSLRVRFQRTYRAVEGHKKGEPNPYDPDDLIVLRGTMPALSTVMTELSQPTFDQTTAGKIVVDKAPDGQRSPNHADAIMIRMAPRKHSFLDYLD